MGGDFLNEGRGEEGERGGMVLREREREEVGEGRGGEWRSRGWRGGEGRIWSKPLLRYAIQKRQMPENEMIYAQHSFRLAQQKSISTPAKVGTESRWSSPGYVLEGTVYTGDGRGGERHQVIVILIWRMPVV